ncbi:transposase [Sinomicrobium pectinilyticum]|uniref:transposase n=1 Tax=Sinomicrobium pectinilyticum TaxID=1084421 RepID=UPI001F0CB285|nr:transposase [Sinomicrobium pectinilyticum]
MIALNRRCYGQKKKTISQNRTSKSGFKSFQTVANSISLNYRSILNYFINRSTNASAKSFNTKRKALRVHFRGVRNTEFTYSDYLEFFA